MRNSAIGKAESYHNKGKDNSEFNTVHLVKTITDQMPIFNKHVASLLAQKQLDTANQTMATSIMGKALGMDKVNTADEHIKLDKGQKKDSLYARRFASIHFIFHLDFFPNGNFPRGSATYLALSTSALYLLILRVCIVKFGYPYWPLTDHRR